MPPRRDETEGEPKKNSGDDKKNFEKVVDELRNVLAGLNNPKPEDITPIMPPGLADDPVPPDDSFLRPQTPPLMPPEEEPEKLGETAFRQAAGLGSNQPSDQEFWNGNVLGWPSGNPPIDEPEEPPLFSPPSPGVPQDKSPRETPSPTTPSLADRLWFEGHVEDEAPPSPPKAPPPKPEPPKPQPLRPTPQRSPLEFDDFQLPPAPVPPSADSSSDIAPIENQKIIFEPFAGDSDFSMPAVPPAPKQADLPPEPSRTVLPANLKIPIPETLHQLPPVKKPNVPESTLSEMDIPHQSSFGIACVYPEGREAECQEFANKLKAVFAGSPQAKKALEVVLMTPWSRGQMNAHALKKAASISGANMLYVLASRNDKDLFKDISRKGHKDDVSARLVILEQVPMRALYADLLVDLLRSLDVKG